jgi:hypothetical protein
MIALDLDILPRNKFRPYKPFILTYIKDFSVGHLSLMRFISTLIAGTSRETLEWKSRQLRTIYYSKYRL